MCHGDTESDGTKYKRLAAVLRRWSWPEVIRCSLGMVVMCLVLLDRVLTGCYAPTLLRRAQFGGVGGRVGVGRKLYSVGAGWNVIVPPVSGCSYGGAAECYLA